MENPTAAAQSNSSSANTRHVLTIDIGTTSAKVLIVSDDGKVVASAQEFYPTDFPQPGFAVQDPNVVVNGILKIIKSAKEQFAGDVDGIGVSSAMHSMMAVDAKGTPLTPLILWSDMRSTEQAKKLQKSAVGSEIYNITGTPIHPMSPLCKLMWIRENEPDLIKNASKFISIKEYLFLVLCGQTHVDYSVASSSGLFDVHKLDWSQQALEVAGITGDKLSRCVSPYNQELRIKKELASSLGLDTNIPVIPGASDGCLAHLGSNAMEKGRLSLTIGTSGAVRMASKSYAPDPKQRTFNYRLDEHTFISGGATNNGTVLLNWFCKNFYSGSSSITEFANVASAVDPGAGGLIFLPFVFGERAPHYNPDLRGVFFGLAQHHTQQHLMRALLEGICLEVRSIVESIEQSIEQVTGILASGGFVRSPEWLQMMANVLQKSITLHDVNDASSLGAALVAFKSLGIATSFEGSEKKLVFEPDASLLPLYDDVFGIFSRSTRLLEKEFSNIVRLQHS
ncbi:MAG: gluconokinase [Bacteroidota bacterium]